MFKNYIFKEQDFRAVERAIVMAYDRRLERVFARGLGDFDLISYDTRFIYLWSRDDYPHLEKFKESVCQFQIYRFPHNRRLEGLDFVRMGLATGDFQLGGKLFKKIPKEISVQAVPLTIWMEILKKKYEIPKKDWPFEKAYYPIILLHEIAHFCFFTKFNFKTPVQKKVLNLGKRLVKNPKELGTLSEKGLTELLRPTDSRALGELFSTLVELEATKIFYPKFLKKNIKQMATFTAKRIEDAKDVRVGEIEVAINANLYGRILAVYIFKSFPNWPKLFHQHLKL